MSEFNTLYNKYIELSGTAVKQLVDYNWPGNIRELRNLIERIVVMNSDGLLEKISDDAFFNQAVKAGKDYNSSSNSLMFVGLGEGSASYKKSMEMAEEYILRKTRATCKNMSEMAEKLQLDRTTIGRKLKKYNIK